MEKQGYRDTLAVLSQRFPALIRKGDVAEYMGCSERTVARMVAAGKLKAENGKVTIGSLAWLIC